MAIQWGAYEGASGRGMRVGIECTPQAAGHNDNYGRIDLTIYTQNNARFTNDTMNLNYSLDIGGSTSFNNNQGASAGPDGNGVVARDTKTYAYSYGANQYGSSPGVASFKALISGADNGITPGVTATCAIPARPVAVPDAVFFQNAQVQSDTSIRVVWLQTPSAPQPITNIYVYRWLYNAPGWVHISTLNAQANNDTTAEILDQGVGANRKVAYLIRTSNAAGTADAQTPDVWTTPAAPSNVTRITGTGGTSQLVTWTNNVAYPEYRVVVARSVNGGAYSAVPGSPFAAGTTSFNDTGLIQSNKYQYFVQVTDGPLPTGGGGTSAAVYTTQSAGTTTAPAAPTNLAPASDTVVSGETPIPLTWTYNSTDGSDQTQFELQHREVGGSTWFATSPPVQVTNARSYALAAGTYGYAKHIEWQVRTWGLNTTLPSAFTKVAFLTAEEVPVKYNLVLNVTTGRVEALSGGGAAGVGDANVFYYEQNYAAATNSVGYAHGLGTKGLEIEFYDNTGVRRYGDITKTPDTITMTFTNAVAGTMIVYGAVAA